MTDEKAARWREERREAAAAHGELLASRQRAESAQAQEQIDAFLRRALTSGPSPEPLAARSYDGRARYKTPLVGWYLRRDETVAIDTDGKFYVLTVPSSLAARFRGVTPEPSAPPLVIGAGGKDGESIDMSQALARVLGG
ncbi:hypothetical protein [Cellulomonas sp. Leaf395]|uniref:hypothetical protein n=1 Tax=Cellulomonas sp. Leaf395 TaxID=1736362 RepID=UPI0006FCF2E1|nr:hypothetical protein [Cellulomonas sp. Leaf395]KQT01438.1 hypothetical protein ASG23_07770 [Cellulomonas sp. Leaf395]